MARKIEKGALLKMNPSKTQPKKSVLIVLESVLHLAVIPLSLWLFTTVLLLPAQGIQELLNAEDAAELRSIASLSDGKPLAMLLFLVLAAIRVVLALRARKTQEAGFGFFMIQAGLFLLGAALPLIFGFTPEMLSYLSILYALVMIAGRIRAIARRRRLRTVLLNVLCILIFLLGLLIFLATDILIFALAVLSLLRIVFGSIHMGVLVRIVRKTYAGEIFFGMVLLIVTFAFLLYYLEPGVNSFSDALWYCFAIVTTIGFGDLTAVTGFGRILSVILGAYGIVVVALITSIIVNFYGETKTDGDASEGEESHGA